MLVCVLVFFSLYNARPSTLEFNIQMGGFTMKLMKLNLPGPFQGHGRGPKEIFTFVLNLLFIICFLFKSTPKIVKASGPIKPGSTEYTELIF
jgi:K+-transporting ATPase A subunit